MTNVDLYLTSSWQVVEESNESLVLELNKEISSSHKLAGVDFKSLAKCKSNDDVLFIGEKNNEEFYVLVHLSWRGTTEENPEFPSFKLFESLEDFKKYIEANPS